MSVYVDDAQKPLGRMKMAHMLADTQDELEAMATKIGLSLHHIQNPDQINEHFDVSMAYRRKAIAEGAISIDQRGLVKLIRKKRRLAEAEIAEVLTGMGDVAKTIKAERLAEIAAIPDEEIDTSDVPEQDAEFFSEAELREPIAPGFIDAVAKADMGEDDPFEDDPEDAEASLAEFHKEGGKTMTEVEKDSDK